MIVLLAGMKFRLGYSLAKKKKKIKNSCYPFGLIVL